MRRVSSTRRPNDILSTVNLTPGATAESIVSKLIYSIWPPTNLLLCGSPAACGGLSGCPSCSTLSERQHDLVVCRPLRFRSLKFPLRSEEHTSELQSLRHLVC